MERAPSTIPLDDVVLPFQVDALDVRGRIVRLGAIMNELLEKHHYPDPLHAF